MNERIRRKTKKLNGIHKKIYKDVVGTSNSSNNSQKKE